jgi:uncharacterized RDD family membrane protein YckC
MFKLHETLQTLKQLPMNTTTTAPVTTTAYAGFGIRLVALIIDWIVIGVLQAFVFVPVLTVLGLGFATGLSGMESGEGVSDAQAAGMIGALIAGFASLWILTTAICLLYFAIMESSKAQATLGKMAVGIKVTDMNGDRISFGKGLLRSIGKQISAMIMCIGYLIAAFTEKKQALHDMIASTLVLKK